MSSPSSSPRAACHVREASRAEMPLCAGLFREYQQALGFGLDFQSFDDELAALPGPYARAAGGVLLLAEAPGGEVAGVVAMRRIDAAAVLQRATTTMPAAETSEDDAAEAVAVAAASGGDNDDDRLAGTAAADDSDAGATGVPSVDGDDDDDDDAVDDAAGVIVVEMKRMYVRREHRGRGVGRALATAVIAEARAVGATRMVLDSVEELHGALALYASLGFTRRAPYCHNPLPHPVWLELVLQPR